MLWNCYETRQSTSRFIVETFPTIPRLIITNIPIPSEVPVEKDAFGSPEEYMTQFAPDPSENGSAEEKAGDSASEYSDADDTGLSNLIDDLDPNIKEVSTFDWVEYIYLMIKV